jgi:hypothetical protein
LMWLTRVGRALEGEEDLDCGRIVTRARPSQSPEVAVPLMS